MFYSIMEVFIISLIFGSIMLPFESTRKKFFTLLFQIIIFEAIIKIILFMNDFKEPNLIMYLLQEKDTFMYGLEIIVFCFLILFSSFYLEEFFIPIVIFVMYYIPLDLFLLHSPFNILYMLFFSIVAMFLSSLNLVVAIR